jgi:hypothetical protein
VLLLRQKPRLQQQLLLSTCAQLRAPAAAVY